MAVIHLRLRSELACCVADDGLGARQGGTCVVACSSVGLEVRFTTTAI